MEKFRNKVLYIEDEKMLEEVKQLLIEKGEKLVSDKNLYHLESTFTFNFIQKGKSTGEWYLSCKGKVDQELTYDEFKNLLNSND